MNDIKLKSANFKLAEDLGQVTDYNNIEKQEEDY